MSHRHRAPLVPVAPIIDIMSSRADRGSSRPSPTNTTRLSVGTASLAVMTELTGNTLQGPPVAGDETATLLGSLERQRATFAWKAGGLDAAGLRATVGVSSMTLGGLIKHLA